MFCLILLNSSGRLNTAMMHNVDWGPTFVAAAGGNASAVIEADKLDGLSIWPALVSNSFVRVAGELRGAIDYGPRNDVLLHLQVTDGRCFWALLCQQPTIPPSLFSLSLSLSPSLFALSLLFFLVLSLPAGPHPPFVLFADTNMPPSHTPHPPSRLRPHGRHSGLYILLSHELNPDPSSATRTCNITIGGFPAQFADKYLAPRMATSTSFWTGVSPLSRTVSSSQLHTT